MDKGQLTWTNRTSFGWMLSNSTWIDQPVMQPSVNGPKLAFLWGNPQDDQLNGTLVKLQAGFTGKIRSHGSTFRAVVIQGRPQYQVPGETNIKTLEPGSYVSSEGESVHQVSCEAGEACIPFSIKLFCCGEQ